MVFFVYEKYYSYKEYFIGKNISYIRKKWYKDFLMFKRENIWGKTVQSIKK